MGNEIEKLQTILQEDPSNFQARRELSILLADNGFNEEALSNLQYLVKYFSEDEEIQYNLGILYEKVKDFENAKESYKKAIDISPQADFYYNLGEVLVELKEWDEAIDAFKFVLQSDPRDGNCYFNLGVCYYNKDELNLATDNFQQAVNMNPQDIFAHFYLGNIYQSNGLTNFAIESYNKVLSISPDYSWAYFNLASIAFKNENFEEARRYLLKTIEYNYMDIEAYKLLVKICVKENEIEEIISILKTRLEKEENGDLFYILAQVYRHLGEDEDYAENLEKALANHLTLTYKEGLVKRELEMINSKLRRNEKSLTKEIEEYQEEFSEEDDFKDSYDEEADDFEEESYDEDFEDDEANEDNFIEDEE